MTALITAEHLQRDYEVARGPFSGSATLRAVADATFTVEEGTTLAIVGESGCGKSTLARLLTMIEPPSGGALTIDGRDVTAGRHEDLRALRSTVQIVFQNPYGSLNPRHKIGAILEEPLKINTALSAAGRRERALGMLAEVGLRPEHYDRYPHMFSGGQRQRIAIARALMLEPKILVLDEPVSALDVSIQAQILNLLADLQEKRGLTYVFISHALAVVRHVADNVMVMYLGRGVEIAPSETLFSAPRHPYTQALLAATPIADPERRGRRTRLGGELPSPFNPPPGCPFHPRCPFANERCRTERPELKLYGETRAACHGVEENRIPAPAAPPLDATVSAV
ncbi:MAG TPA: dipeptide ABC transporter ATP-binding protein [Devosia sp.]|nr:dipeptide ABC transporter ATP-binding protein [Devosia sp.]